MQGTEIWIYTYFILRAGLILRGELIPRGGLIDRAGLILRDEFILRGGLLLRGGLIDRSASIAHPWRRISPGYQSTVTRIYVAKLFADSF